MNATADNHDPILTIDPTKSGTRRDQRMIETPADTQEETPARDGKSSTSVTPNNSKLTEQSDPYRDTRILIIMAALENCIM
jgi:hypothetical protein